MANLERRPALPAVPDRRPTPDLDAWRRNVLDLTPVARNPQRPIVAAGYRLDPRGRGLDEGRPGGPARKWGSPEQWQNDAWAMYDLVGAVKYPLGTFLPNCDRRLRVYPAIVVDPDEPPVYLGDLEGDEPGVTRSLVDDADRLLSDLEPQEGGLGALLAGNGVGRSVSGDGYIVQRQVAPGVFDTRWYSEAQVRKARTVIPTRGNPEPLETVERPDQRVGDPIDPDTDLVLRVYRPHAKWSGLADSNLRGVLGVCEEMLMIERALRAGYRSRVPAGVFLYPEELDDVIGPSFRPNDPGYDPEFDAAAGEVGAEPLRASDMAMEHFTTAIEDTGSAADYAPFMLRGKADYLKFVRHVQVERGLDGKLLERTTQALTLLGVGLNVPPEVITGLADVKYCADEATEVLSRRGWLRYDQLTTDDEVLALDHDTGLSQWEPVVAVNVFDAVNEPMVAMRNKAHDSLTTFAHRWPTFRPHSLERSWQTSLSLTASDRVIRAAPCAVLPIEPKWSDAFVELVGWFYTEGHFRPDGRWGEVTQSATHNPGNVARIRAALTALLGPARRTLSRSEAASAAARTTEPTWREVQSPDGTIRWYLNRPAFAPFLDVMDARTKVVRPEFVTNLTAAQLALFVDVSVAADGNSRSNGQDTFWQKDPARIDALEMACALLGRATQRSRDGHHLGMSRCRTWCSPVPTARVQRYTGKVWCPTTPSSTWLARRNGSVYWTGNSNAWAISDSTYANHVEPDAQACVDTWATLYLRPGLLALGHDPRLVRRVGLALDPSKLVVRPNRGQDAKDAFDRMAIGHSALRRYLNMRDADAPSEEELTLMLAAGDDEDALPAAGGGDGSVDEGGDTTPQGANARSNGSRLRVGPRSRTATSVVAAGRGVRTGEVAKRLHGTGRSAPENQVVAAAVPRGTSLGQRLARIDSALIDRWAVLVDTGATEAGRRAAARLRSMVQADARLRGMVAAACGRESIAGVPADRVAPVLRAAGEVIDGDALLAGSFDDLAARWDREVSAAHEQAVALFAAEGGDPDVANTGADDDRRAGWLVLLAALRDAATRYLYDPTPDADGAPAALGEADPAARVNAGPVRAALGRAGGDTVAERPVGGVATGPRVLGAFATIGLAVTEWEWSWSGSAVPFEPHMNLSGLRFTSWEDDRLRNTGPFPFGGFYRPNDHAGCGCLLIPHFDISIRQ